MKNSILNGIKGKEYKFSDGTVVQIPDTCRTRTKQIKPHVFKALLAKDWNRLKKYGVNVMPKVVA